MKVNSERTVNLLGAFAVALTDAIRGAAEDASGHGLTGAAALTTVEAYPGEPLDALALTLGLSAAGASRLADRLQADGLIERVGGQKDGRSRLVMPTEAGEARARKVLRARQVVIARALAPLDTEEAAQLTKLLERMLTALTPDRVTCDHICRLCEIGACPQDRCPVELAASRTEA